MVVNVSPALATDAEDVEIMTASSSVNTSAASRLDFAEVAGGKLLIYGWIVNFSKAVRSAILQLDTFSVDLVSQAIPVRRPDVSQHFSLNIADEGHGFYGLYDLPVDISAVDQIDFRIELTTGEISQSYWPVSSHAAPDTLSQEPYLTVLSQLLKRLPRFEARRLVSFVGPSLKQSAATLHAPSLPPPIEFGIDLCCMLDHGTLVLAGWCVDIFQEISSVVLKVGNSVRPLWRDVVSFAHVDFKNSSSSLHKAKPPNSSGFFLIHEFPPEDSDAGLVALVFTIGQDTVQITRQIASTVHEARRDFLSFFQKIEPDLALTLCKRISLKYSDGFVGPSVRSLLQLAGAKSLEATSSTSIHNHHPRYVLHIDQTIQISHTGIFLTGWFNSVHGEPLEIVCHLGESNFNIGDHWFRQSRPDVSAHLASLGVSSPNHQHGFACYVTLGDEDSPYTISVTTQSGESRHLRVALPEAQLQPLETIRALLTSFSSASPELRSRMDRQIGPAVLAAWSGQRASDLSPSVRSFGPIPAHPVVSVIVPLYGRYDFATYQLALFANDPEFRHLELIYVVDDPFILADFIRACDDLHGIYEVPFLVVSSGRNLGFAGANNLAARVARGRYLLFLNSDVMPRRAGWVGDLVRTYQSLSDPGILGAKLLYEDGSLQHVGIAFRRYPGWGDLWINDHPLKGQSPVGLEGVHSVHAVTAACTLTEASLFREASGFSEDYIIGDFEDTDLCLQLASQGRQNYITLDVELYHLERQSQNRMNDSNWRANLTLYNCWLHNQRWGDIISGLKQDSPDAAETGSSERKP